jgi:(4S)-4-hydroxy-5-phosphonooxypentane-2,3-dione isomerase
MLIIQVFVHVKPECVTDFLAATRENAEASLREPGIARFDVLQEQADATRCTLIEAYRDDDAPAAHKATAHYARWRDVVAPMMAEPRHSVQYRTIHDPG